MSDLSIQARFTTTEGKGVGRWRNYYRAEDMREVTFAVRHLVPSAQMRVLQGRDVVVDPVRVETFLADEADAKFLRKYGDNA